MKYKNDPRIVMTLDAGGTNLVFSAIRGGEEIIPPVHIHSTPKSLESMLAQIVEGFSRVEALLPEKPAAISFAFPGPADYSSGTIGDLPNIPSFRGGIALGPFLQEKFEIPVFINNDGDLFAYGEALTGVLPEVNGKLRKLGSLKQYRNLIGVTMGTGFGGGLVIDGKLHAGDNAAGGDIYLMRNKKYPQYIIEESVSIRAVKRVYAERSGKNSNGLSPLDIHEIAFGRHPGDRDAACHAFSEMGELAGDALCSVATLIDGLIVIGGGLSNAAGLFMPALIREMNSHLSMADGTVLPRLQMKVFNLDDEEEFNLFAHGQATRVAIPGTDRFIDYDPMKRIGIMTTKQGTSRSIAQGAYMFALNNL